MAATVARRAAPQLTRHLPRRFAPRTPRARRFSTQHAPAITHVPTWLAENAASFAPPVMNKLLHHGELSVMFVGGPNERLDFHLEEGSEFFYQLRGDMELPIVHGGRRETVRIREGEVFLLPSRIPHSPQRPQKGSLGLVVERQRYDDEAHDGLRYYVDFDTCDEVLWEKYFRCHDLGKDLAPVVAAFRASEEGRTGRPTGANVYADPPLTQDTATVVPPPFSLARWLDDHRDALASGASLDLFEGHPDGEFDVRVVGGGRDGASLRRVPRETWLYQLRGGARLAVDGAAAVELADGACAIVPAGAEFRVERPAGTIGMEVCNDRYGNKPGYLDLE